jgi:hypothetical protein
VLRVRSSLAAAAISAAALLQGCASAPVVVTPTAEARGPVVAERATFTPPAVERSPAWVRDLAFMRKIGAEAALDEAQWVVIISKEGRRAVLAATCLDEIAYGEHPGEVAIRGDGAVSMPNPLGEAVIWFPYVVEVSKIERVELWRGFDDGPFATYSRAAARRRITSLGPRPMPGVG